MQLSLTLQTTEQGVRFKAIGKAAIKGTKQIGKTLTAMSDSPDKRGRGKLAEVNAAQFQQREKRKRKAKGKQAISVSDESLGLDTSEFHESELFSCKKTGMVNLTHFVLSNRSWWNGFG